MSVAPADPKMMGRDRSDGVTGGGPEDRGPSAEGLQRNANAEDAGATYDFLSVVRLCEERDQIFKGAIQRNAWRRSYDAFHNRHSSDSKYSDTAWKRKRTSLFRPKTRVSVRKAMAAAAASLFTTSDVVSISAESKDNPKHAASAAINQELLGYRLDRTSAKAGIPWFMVVMGAHLDAQIMGIMYSKQFWEYEKVTERATEIVQLEQYYEDSGEKVVDPMTGEPLTATERRDIEKEYVTKDRPQSMNWAPDNVMIDPAAPWVNAAQASGYLILRCPMPIDDARQMLQNPGKGGEQWLEVTDAMLLSVVDEYTSKGVRSSRSSDRTDPLENRQSTSPDGKGSNEIVWLYECFLRIGGVDYHFWTLGSRYYASQIRTTRQAYPEQRGERPVTRGYASIETYETFPMAPVAAWNEMQKELNDVVNLRLDTMKQALSPIAKVKQGSTFDFKQLHNRAGQDTTIIVRNMEDLEFDRSPDVTAGAYQETNLLNADFDDLAGVFTGGSVSTNRSLNETVGGMQLLSGAANSVTEFDLRVFIETWVEPTLRQIVKLEQYYESDETILAIAGDRAKLMERFGVDQITDEDLEREVTVRVNVGLGAADPMARLTKLRLGLSTLEPLLPFMDKKVTIKADEIIKEIMGAIGFNDGLRFVTLEDLPQQGGQDPEAQKAQLEAQISALKQASEERIATGDRQSAQDMEAGKQQMALLQTLLKGVMDLQKHNATLGSQMTQHGQKLAAGFATERTRQQSQRQIAAMRGPPAKAAAGARK